MRLNEITLPAPKHLVRKNFYDIYRAVTPNDGKAGLSINKRSKAELPDEMFNAGIYAWWHPKFGYFYIGIHSGKTQRKPGGPINTDYVNDMSDRWNKHIQKLINNLNPGTSMGEKWKAFSKRYKDLGFGLEDFKDIEIHLWPIAKRSDYPPGEAHDMEFRKELEKIERELIYKHNTAANSEHDPERYSITRYGDTLKTKDDHKQWREIEPAKREEFKKKEELRKQADLKKQENLVKRKKQEYLEKQKELEKQQSQQ